MGWFLYFLAVMLASGITGGLTYQFQSPFQSGYQRTPIDDRTKGIRAGLFALIPIAVGTLLGAAFAALSSGSLP